MERIGSGGPYEEAYAYSRAVVAGGWVFVAGTTGADPETGILPDTIADQCHNALATIDAALKKAGATLSDVTRVHYILPDRRDFEHCAPILRDAFGGAPPAATMIEAGLIDPKMKIEIEVTALLRECSGA